jgi:hypothetical protein
MAMSDVEERRGLKIMPGSVEVQEGGNRRAPDTALMSYFFKFKQLTTIESAAGDKG